MQAGDHQLKWNAANIANGMYYLKFNAGNYAAIVPESLKYCQKKYFFPIENCKLCSAKKFLSKKK